MTLKTLPYWVFLSMRAFAYLPTQTNEHANQGHTHALRTQSTTFQFVSKINKKSIKKNESKV